MDDAALLELADLNLVEFNRESARGTKRGVVHEEGGMVFFMPDHRLPVGATGVIRTDRSVPAPSVLDRAAAFFGERGTGYTVWVARHRDEDLAALLEAHDVPIFGGRASPGMVLDAPLPEKPLHAGTRLVRITDARGVADFGAINAAAYATYGMPPGIAEAQFADADFWLAPHIALFIAYHDDQPLAAAMTYLSHGVGGVYWVGCVPEGRGRGLAAACTRRATNAGFEMGGRFASLQASVMGEPIYTRMGYREITRYPWYLIMP